MLRQWIMFVQQITGLSVSLLTICAYFSSSEAWASTFSAFSCNCCFFSFFYNSLDFQPFKGFWPRRWLFFAVYWFCKYIDGELLFVTTNGWLFIINHLISHFRCWWWKLREIQGAFQHTSVTQPSQHPKSCYPSF